MKDATDCQAIIHAWHGYSYNSNRKPDPVVIDEARNRMSIKSQNYVGAELNPQFSRFVFGVDEDFHHGDSLHLRRNEISETFSMLMGL